MFVDRRFDLFSFSVVITILSDGRDRFDDAAGLCCKRAVVRVERFSYENVVTGIENGSEDHRKRFAAAICDEDILALQFDVKPLEIVDDCVVKDVHTAGFSIGDDFFIKSTNRIHVAGRCLDIRLSDVQMIDFFPFCFRFKSKFVETADG